MGRNVCARIHDDGVDQKAVSDAIQQRVTIRGHAIFAAEGLVRVEQDAPLPFPRVILVFRVEAFQVIFGRGGESQFVPNEILKDGAAVPADTTVGFIGDHQVEVIRREQSLIAVFRHEGLHCRDDDLCLAPVIAVFLIHHRLIVVLQVIDKRLLCLIFQLQPVHQEQYPPCIAGTQEEFDHRCRDKSLSCPGCHFEQEAVFPLFYMLLDRSDRLQLVFPQKAKPVILNELRPRILRIPRRIVLIIWFLREDNIIFFDHLTLQARRVRLEAGITFYRFGGGELLDRDRVAALRVPEVMRVTI